MDRKIKTHYKWRVLPIVLTSLFLSGGLMAENTDDGGDGSEYYFDQLNSVYDMGRDNVSMRLKPLDYGLMGDKIDPFTGALFFSATDVSIPGNSGLEVAFRRRTGLRSTTNIPEKEEDRQYHPLADWVLDVPYLTQFDHAGHPDLYSLGSFELYNISVGGLGEPSCLSGFTIDFSDGMSWLNDEGVYIGHLAVHGSLKVNIPGQGEEVVNSPFDYSYDRISVIEKPGSEVAGVTLGNTLLVCEGGKPVAVLPNGTKYSFSARVERPTYPAKVSRPKSATVERKQILVYATEVRDIHGNWVKYDFDNDGKLTHIYSNDNREIIVYYYPGSRRVSRVVANGREWNYIYEDSQKYITNSDGTISRPFGKVLSKVVLPDGRSWEYNIDNLTSRSDYTTRRQKDRFISFATDVSVKHPMGATGKFILTKYNQHAEKDDCWYSYDTKETNCSYLNTMQYGVTEKRIAGNKMEESVWEYTYQSHPSELGVSFDTKLTTEKNPDGTYVTRSFYSKYTDSSAYGKKLNEIAYSALGGQELQANYYDYVPVCLGYNENSNTCKELPEKEIVTRGSDSYVTEYEYNNDIYVNNFSYGKPTKITTYSNLSTQKKITDITYNHNKSLWVLGNKSTIKRNDFKVADLFYDSKHRLNQISGYVPQIPSVTAGYSTGATELGAIAWTKDALGRTTSYQNYYRGIPKKIINPDGSFTQRDADANGWLKWVEDELGHRTSYYYDNMGLLTTIVHPDGGNNTNITYTNLGLDNTYQQITRGNYQQTIWYDSLNRPVKEKEADLTNSVYDRYLRFEYDKLGRKSFSSLPSVNEDTYYGIFTEYDGLGRVVKESSNAEPYATTSKRYLDGGKVEVTDANGNISEYTYHAFGSPGKKQLVNIRYPGISDTSITYDVFGNRTIVTQRDFSGYGNRSNHRFYYDDKKRLCRYSAPELGTTYYAYDNANQLTAKIEGRAAGIGCSSPLEHSYNDGRIKYTYDLRGRQKLIDFPSGTNDVSFDYYLNGKTKSVNRGGSSWNYTYNNAGKLLSEGLTVDGRAYSAMYSYNDNGVLSGMRTVGGEWLDYAPNALGQPTKVTSNLTNYFTNISYYANNQLKHGVYGNGLEMGVTLHANQQIESMFLNNGSSSLLSYNYDYDASGNIQSIIDNLDSNENRYMEYDGMNRLVAADGPWGAGSFDYDGLGNIRSKSLGGSSVLMSYSTNNRLTSYKENSTWRSMDYDHKGNVTNNGRVSLSYDAANQPTSMGSQASGQFTYDGNFKRIKQVINGETIYSVYGQSGALLYRDNASTNKKTDYIRLKGRTIARVSVGGTSSSSSAAPGELLWKESYTPYGKKRLNPAGNQNNEGFTGHIEDSASGLTYMQARYYDPVIGRFLSNDPVGFAEHMERGNNIQGLNRYAYANNNPYRYIDPDGKKPNWNIVSEVDKKGRAVMENSPFTSPEEGQYTIGGHGNWNGPVTESGNRYNIDDFIAGMKKNGYTGKEDVIKLYICWAGRERYTRRGQPRGSFAKELARRLGKKVIAATNMVFITPNGVNILNGGEWKTERPDDEEKDEAEDQKKAEESDEEQSNG